jgi:MFS family permease
MTQSSTTSTIAEAEQGSLIAALKSAWPLFFGLAMIMIGNGLQGTLLGVRAAAEEFPTWMTGLVMSFYYFGFLAGSLVVPKMLGTVGHIRVFAALASLASTMVLIHGVILDPWAWLPVRLITGFSYAGLYIVVESWLNDNADNANRGKVMALYLLVSYLGISIGQLLLNVADPRDIELFIITSILVSLALVPISLTTRPAPAIDTPKPTRLKKIYKQSPLGVVSCATSGFVNGIIFSIAPVYAIAAGLSNANISIFMTVMVVGGVAFQMPYGWVSDRVDRRSWIIVLSFISSASAVMIFFFIKEYWILTLFLLLIYGGASMAIYGVAAAHTNDHVEQEEIVSTSATLVLMNGAGACFGPIIITTLMDGFSSDIFFPFVAFSFAVMGVFGIYRTFRRESIPVEEQGDYVLMPARVTPLTAQIIEDDQDEEGWEAGEEKPDHDQA